MKAGRCHVCKRVIRINADGSLRKHWRGGLRANTCDGSTTESSSEPMPTATLRGRMLFFGEGCMFVYQTPDPLTRDDVNRIMLTLLSHVEETTR